MVVFLADTHAGHGRAVVLCAGRRFWRSRSPRKMVARASRDGLCILRPRIRVLLLPALPDSASDIVRAVARRFGSRPHYGPALGADHGRDRGRDYRRGFLLLAASRHLVNHQPPGLSRPKILDRWRRPVAEC